MQLSMHTVLPRTNCKIPEALLHLYKLPIQYKRSSQESAERNIYSRMLARVCVVAMVKNKAYKMVLVYFKKIQLLDCFYRLPTMN